MRSEICYSFTQVFCFVNLSKVYFGKILSDQSNQTTIKVDKKPHENYLTGNPAEVKRTGMRLG